MNILVVNGSPRKQGNTSHALAAVMKGLEKAGHKMELIRAYDLNLKPCIACNGCKRNGGKCVLPDDSAAMMEKVSAADMILFGTPVYWWGVTAQIKLFLDKFYSKDSFHDRKKKLGVIATGEAELNDPQYRLIREQFECICNFLGWDFVLKEFNSAADPDDLAKNADRLAELEKAGAAL